MLDEDPQDSLELQFNRNPDCCEACKEGKPCGSRRNPCCDSCAEGQGCSDKRFLRRKNPQPPVWQSPVFPREGAGRAAWGSNFFRNPQPPVWQEPVYPSHGQSRAAWGSNFFRGRKNPQPPVWQKAVFPAEGAGRAVWGSNFFRNPQPPVWQEPVYPSHGESRAVWGSNFFRRNPDGYRVSVGENVFSEWPYLLMDCHMGQGDPVYALASRLHSSGETIATEGELEASLRALREVARNLDDEEEAGKYEVAADELEQFINNASRRNPQPPVWQEPVYPSHGESRAAWGPNFFRNPQPPVWQEPVYPSHGQSRAVWGNNFFRNPQPPVWQEPVYPSHGESRAAWGSNFFRNPQPPVWQKAVFPSEGQSRAAWGGPLFGKRLNRRSKRKNPSWNASTFRRKFFR